MARRRLALECLEERVVLSTTTIQVNLEPFSETAQVSTPTVEAAPGAEPAVAGQLTDIVQAEILQTAPAHVDAQEISQVVEQEIQQAVQVATSPSPALAQQLSNYDGSQTVFEGGESGDTVVNRVWEQPDGSTGTLPPTNADQARDVKINLDVDVARGDHGQLNTIITVTVSVNGRDVASVAKASQQLLQITDPAHGGSGATDGQAVITDIPREAGSVAVVEEQRDALKQQAGAGVNDSASARALDGVKLPQFDDQSLVIWVEWAQQAAADPGNEVITPAVVMDQPPATLMPEAVLSNAAPDATALDAAIQQFLRDVDGLLNDVGDILARPNTWAWLVPMALGAGAYGYLRRSERRRAAHVPVAPCWVPGLPLSAQRS